MKNENFPTLKTKYSIDMDKESPWNYYPRPNMVRDSFFSLNGEWDIELTDKKNKTYFEGKILVPFPPESFLSGVEKTVDPNGTMRYRKEFSLPQDFVKDRVLLHFGAVDQICDVYLNGFSVGRHEGGYIPFSIDVTEHISNAKNELIVIAADPLLKKYPYGKQTKKRGGMWYTPVSGIWQTVWLESIPQKPFISLEIEQNTECAKIKINTRAEFKKLTLRADGSVYNFCENTIVIEPKEKRLWSPEDPFLYEFELESETDRITSYFALREISTININGKETICLNGKPYFLSALLDQGYYPDGIFLPATKEGYEDDILLAKKLGFNALRKHIKIEPLIFYHLCDKLGIIVVQDMVNNSGYSFLLDTALPTVGLKRYYKNLSLRHRRKSTRDIFIEHSKSTVELLRNFPSICIYTIFNEGWGQFDPHAAYALLKNLDPSRLYDATSGWFSCDAGDFDSRHIYFKYPSIKKTNGKPVFLSEFGGFSLRVDGHLFGTRNYGYSLYRSKDEFTDAVFSLYCDGVLPLISEGLCATVYTQLSDVEDETNGLVTYDRSVVKIDEERMKHANERLYDEFYRVTNN